MKVWIDKYRGKGDVVTLCVLIGSLFLSINLNYRRWRVYFCQQAATRSCPVAVSRLAVGPLWVGSFTKTTK